MRGPAVVIARGARELYRRWRSRRELARMDSRLLRDAGIHALDARAEARKPFWRR